ncbi:hypothetical protein HXX76_004221 [Chlamydomonas incerta]|uniref:Uncharacterized protein n=1 Tax=Chlamydomonas incerta TaxID=51695 RepID=A0A835T712_CHLIN|nr:hypothetical protein HXX76_004221 [Chlamydomonas incerta]|eukprot:KAG2440107.1 hypothetical protein HXX76_004221 [Chlamydomonas incerta]
MGAANSHPATKTPPEAPAEQAPGSGGETPAAVAKPRRRTRKTAAASTPAAAAAAAPEHGGGDVGGEAARSKPRATRTRRTRAATATTEGATAEDSGGEAAEVVTASTPAAAAAAAPEHGGGDVGGEAARSKPRATRTRRTRAATATTEGATAEDSGGEAAEVVTALRKHMKLGKSPWHVSAADRAALAAAFLPAATHAAATATDNATTSSSGTGAPAAAAAAGGAANVPAALERAESLLQLFGDSGRQLLLAAPGWALGRPLGELLQWLDAAVACIGPGATRLWLLQVAAREPELLLPRGDGGGGGGGVEVMMEGPKAVRARLEELAAAVAAALPVVEQPRELVAAMAWHRPALLRPAAAPSPALVESRLVLLREHLAGGSHAAQYMAGERFHPGVSAWVLSGVLAVKPRPQQQAGVQAEVQVQVEAQAEAGAAGAGSAADAGAGAGNAAGAPGERADADGAAGAAEGAQLTVEQRAAAEAEDGAEALLRLMFSSQQRHRGFAGPAVNKDYAEPLLVGVEDVAAWHNAWRGSYVAWREDALAGDPELLTKLGLASNTEEEEKAAEEVEVEVEGAEIAALLMKQWADARAGMISG